jgi:hypothetical protein
MMHNEYIRHLAGGMNLLQVEPGHPMFVGDWHAQGSPPNATHMLNSLRKAREYGYSAMRDALRPHKYGNDSLLIGPGVENLRVTNGTIMLLAVCDCLGMIGQYRLADGSKILRVSHIDVINGYSTDDVQSFLESINADEPIALNFGIYGNERTQLSEQYGTPLLPRGNEIYRERIYSLIPNLASLDVQTALGSPQIERMANSTVAVASTLKMGDMGHRTFKLDTQNLHRYV